jgi:biotin transport system permease protein
VIGYRPGDSLAHRADPRAKLLVQVGFAAAALAHTTVPGLVVLSVSATGLLVVARTSPLATLREVRVLVPFLLAAPLLQGLTLSAPYFSLAEARYPALASYRVVLVLFVAAAYVRTTPVRESRAAVEWLLPGRLGRFFGAGIGFVFRFLPVLRGDLSRAREASRARLGDRRRLDERMRVVALAGLSRAFRRADAFSLALRARCFAWNPTLPALVLSPVDYPALVLAAALFAWAVAPLVAAGP